MFDSLDHDETFQNDFRSLTPEKLTPGTFLGKDKNFRLEKFLGAGGMGYAWLATEIEDGVELRKVVCKVLPAMVQREKAEMKKVLKTFHLVQPLSHPNICPIYGLKFDPVCGYFFVMGYGDGGTLGDWLLRQPNHENGLPVSRVAEVLRPVALALDHAHEMGIIHRDVKPHNILFVTRGGRMIPWLIDFGISSRIQQTTHMITDQGSRGTPVYMAPEQWENQTQDGRTDQYALGVLAYQLLSGRIPFSASNPIALMGQIINMPAPPLTNVSPEVNSVVQRALSKSRKRRFASCVEFVDALTGKKPSRSSSWDWWFDSLKSFAKALKKYQWPLLAGILAFLMIGLFLFSASPKRPEIAVAPSEVPASEDVENSIPASESMTPISRESFEWDGTKITKFIGEETGVVIPEGTTEIGENAFSGCSSLTSVAIPEGVTKIGYWAFSGCSSLTSVVIPDSVESIGNGAFARCSALKEWKISSTHPYFKTDGMGLLTKDGKTLVACAGAAKEYRIPEGVTEIGRYAFSHCSSLTSVVIPKGVTKIGNEAFLGCSSLTSVVIPEGVTVIGVYAFYGCRSLTSVEIPKGIKEIGRYAFNGCSSLTSVVIPEGVKEIGNRAFDDCQKLTIYAPAGSKAEEYAKEKNIPFQVK